MLRINLKNLREKKKKTQGIIADLIGVSRSTYLNYEKGRSEPPASVLVKIAQYYKVSIDDLLTQDLVAPLFTQKSKSTDNILSDHIRVLPVTVTNDKRQNIEFVPAKAIAGYVTGMKNEDYITNLPKIHIPKLPEGSYRAFEIQGHSMPPIQDGYIVIGQFVEHARDLKNGNRYILILREGGIVFKKVISELTNQKLILSSDNSTTFQPYSVNTKDVLEAWELVAFIGFPNKLDMTFTLLDKLHNIEQQLALLNS